MPYQLVLPNGDIEDEVVIAQRIYKIRFKPRHAEHIWDNYSDSLHRIKHRQILSLVRKSIFLMNANQQGGRFLGKFGNVVYETHVKIEPGLLNIVTSFRSNKRDNIALYEQFEEESR